MAEGEPVFEVNLKLGLLNNDSWRQYKALGVWERRAEGQDGKVEVYVEGHRHLWQEAYSNHQVEYQMSPNGLPQTKVVLEPDRVQLLGLAS